jgi:hypothetical protein
MSRPEKAMVAKGGFYLAMAVLLSSFSIGLSIQVKDFAPLLPHPYNMNAMLGNPVAILPKYVGSLKPGEEITWSGSCFKNTTGFINLTEPVKNGSLGGGVVHIVVRPIAFFCKQAKYIFVECVSLCEESVS